MDLQHRIRLKDGGKNYGSEWKGFFKIELNTQVEDGDYDASDDNDRKTSGSGMIPSLLNCATHLRSWFDKENLSHFLLKHGNQLHFRNTISWL